MAEKDKRVRAPTKRVMDDYYILEVLNESDGDFSAGSDNDRLFDPNVDGNRRNRLHSSSSESDNDEQFSNSNDDSTPSQLSGSIILRRRATSRVVRSLVRGRARNSRRSRGIRARVQETYISPDSLVSSSLTIDSAEDFNPSVTCMLSPNYFHRELDEWEWFQFLEDYLDDEIYDQIVRATNQTSVLLTQKNIGLTVRELKVFIGINMAMSSINYPKIKMYWEQSWRIPLIANSMSRDRYFLLRTHLKIVYDDDVSQEQRAQDRIWKVRPLFDRILRGCHIQERAEKLSIDEMMVPFSGHCGIKQYCPNKPNPVGLKIFVLANPCGIVCDMIVYQGETTFKSYKEQGFGLGEAAVLQMTETLVPGHYLFFDRYFSTIKLIKELLARGFNATGTIMKNRFQTHVSMTPDNLFIKKNRGASEIACLSNGQIAITKWLDNKPVLMISKCYSNNKTDFCKRWDKRQKRYVQVLRPEVIKEYNQNMGGVDLADRMLSVCPSRARTRKWTIRFIFHMIDISVVNAWLLFRETELKNAVPSHKIPQLREYKLRMGTKLIEENILPPEEPVLDDETGFLRVQHVKRSVPITPLPTAHKRTNRADHMPKIEDKRQRCRNNACGFKTDIICSICKIYLCLTKARNCFAKFHGHDI